MLVRSIYTVACNYSLSSLPFSTVSYKYTTIYALCSASTFTLLQNWCYYEQYYYGHFGICTVVHRYMSFQVLPVVVDIPGHRVCICPSLGNNLKLLYKVVVPIYTDSSNTWELPLIHMFTTTCHRQASKLFPIRWHIGCELFKRSSRLQCKAHTGRGEWNSSSVAFLWVM